MSQGRLIHGAVLLLAAAIAPPLAAQKPAAALGHFFSDTDRTVVRLGLDQPLAGPLGGSLYATLLHAAPPGGILWGAGADLSLFRGGAPGPYAVGGLAAGIATGNDHFFWSSWSAGLGYELYPLHGFSVGLEGRWREIHPGHHGGLELGLRLALTRANRAAHTSAGSSDYVPDPSVPEPEAVRVAALAGGASNERAALLSSVVQNATDAMGTPYQWGGQGESGFDCSGLIRYAYGKNGVSLPRRSADQAREGEAVERRVEALLPGDILTFSAGGGPVTHVGLYVGGGKFIHSASHGVQLSVLSATDVYGRWWWNRWVGARRIILQD